MTSLISRSVYKNIMSISQPTEIENDDEINYEYENIYIIPNTGTAHK